MVAPVSGNDVGIQRAEIKNGIREIICCKDGDGKIGLRVRAVNKGVFVAFVHKNSPGNLNYILSKAFYHCFHFMFSQASQFWLSAMYRFWCLWPVDWLTLFKHIDSICFGKFWPF